MRALLVGEHSSLDAGEKLGEVEAVHVLHDQVGVGAIGLEIEDGHDVGVGEEAGGACLRERLVDGRRGDAAWADAAEERHALDGDATLEASVPAGADRAEAALAAS